MSLTLAIKAQAHRLGFHLAAVTTPDPPAHLDVYERWLEAGFHGRMGYLETEHARARRADPRRILPECRSILVLGAFHPAVAREPETEPASGRSPHGRVASYAWGDDYHEVFSERLKVLVDYIETQQGGAVPNRWYTDTGPLLEREFGQRAGLGWIGKNTCLIHPRLGSYFLLAEILLGVDLEPDPPFTADHCGTCTRCLEACPTGCILPDRTLDARRCISYLTIELKEAIPADLRTKIGDWVFGCDICQQVCPWNQRFAPSQGEAVFEPRREVPRPNLHRELTLSPQAFNLKFKDSPVKRAKRRGYLRNVAVALGNSKNSSSVPVLTDTLLAESEPLVRAHVAWALGQIGDQAARDGLRQAHKQELDPSVLVEIEAALEHIRISLAGI